MNRDHYLSKRPPPILQTPPKPSGEHKPAQSNPPDSQEPLAPPGHPDENHVSHAGDTGSRKARPAHGAAKPCRAP